MNRSFRDPGGWVCQLEDRVFRVVNPSGIRDFDAARRSDAVKGFVESGCLVDILDLDATERQRVERLIADTLDDVPGSSDYLLVESRQIAFPSYPYEWPPEMLLKAAKLTLNLAESLLNENLGLKDATPYNILFEGSKPIFVDWLSFEKRAPDDPIWVPQAQFIRTFVLPLLATKHFGIDLNQIFLNKRDGIEPEDIYAMCGPLKRITPPFLSAASLPKWLGSKKSNRDEIYKQHTSADPEKARFILGRQFRQLRKMLNRSAPESLRLSAWADYTGENKHFTDAYFSQKLDFVSDSLKEAKPLRVLDIGCNTGDFSKLAANAGSSVVAIDQDPVVVGKTCQMAAAEKLDILPLAVDISRPSPAMGWRNAECSSFLERSRQHFDMVMMLAVIHHMMVTERIPLNDILRLASDLTKEYLIIEFVPTDDPKFKEISRGRGYLFEGLTEESFREECTKYFSILRSEKLADSDRRIFFLKK